MTTQNTEIGAITAATLRTMRAKLDEAVAIAGAGDLEPGGAGGAG